MRASLADPFFKWPNSLNGGSIRKHILFTLSVSNPPLSLRSYAAFATPASQLTGQLFVAKLFITSRVQRQSRSHRARMAATNINRIGPAGDEFTGDATTVAPTELTRGTEFRIIPRRTSSSSTASDSFQPRVVNAIRLDGDTLCAFDAFAQCICNCGKTTVNCRIRSTGEERINWPAVENHDGTGWPSVEEFSDGIQGGMLPVTVPVGSPAQELSV
ncbi:hypothetical protein B0H16DRAFT_1449256 [Mycena metata]|uniref:Uncharacterized protein n=1 Tax=Mycena metata TaxID=1033252 RepID=A0AAD7NVQ6_9AGAR|nr:hypothetical protein B0H16DRAFT_1449256 [Mycena metata]